MSVFPSGLRRGRQAAVLVVCLAGALGATAAEAQGGRAVFAAGAQGGGGNPGTLPFNSIYRRPALSPYQQLYNFADNPLQNQNVYQQMVMPQLQQQQQQIEQLSQSRRINKLQNQVQQIQRDTSSRQIDESIRPTGHRSTYMNYSHFYMSR